MDLTERSTDRGMRMSSFELDRGGRRIPGHLFEALDGADGPLVLLGHGGSGSSEQDYLVALATHLSTSYSMRCVAIDGPVHGRRRAQGSQPDDRLVLLEFMAAWSSDPSMTDEMVADWRFVLDAFLVEFGARQVGYWGLSMGTILGLPLVAAEPRIEAAVLGLCGISGPSASRLALDAPKVTVPVQMLLQWDDELFSRESVFDLFGLLGADDRRLIAGPGRHAEVSIETFLGTASFLADRLARA